MNFSGLSSGKSDHSPTASPYLDDLIVQTMLLMRRFQGFGLIVPFFEFQPGALGWKRAEKRVSIVFDSGC
jgi:hypothetical protein